MERRRFAACCWGEGRPATCLVMLDEQGSLVDRLYLPSLSGQQLAKRPGTQYNIAEDPKKVTASCFAYSAVDFFILLNFHVYFNQSRAHSNTTSHKTLALWASFCN